MENAADRNYSDEVCNEGKQNVSNLTALNDATVNVPFTLPYVVPFTIPFSTLHDVLYTIWLTVQYTAPYTYRIPCITLYHLL